MIKYLKILIALVLITSCKVSHRQEAFNNFKREVNNEVFQSFPVTKQMVETSSFQTIIYPDAIYASKYSGIFIGVLYKSDAVFEEKIKELENSKLVKLNLEDTCAFFIPEFKTASDNCDKFFPVPSNNPFNDLKISDGEFIVLNSKKGKFLKDNSLLKNDNNGFSNGAIIQNTNEIIYWIIIW